MHDFMMQSSPFLSLSSSFSSYSSDDFAKIAARVVEEVRAESNLDPDHHFASLYDENALKSNEFLDEYPENVLKQNRFHEELEENGYQEKNEEAEEKVENNGDEKEEEEFEFPLMARSSVSSPALADEIFLNGQILPMYSISCNNNNFLPDGNRPEKSRKDVLPRPRPRPDGVRQPLRLLFLEDRDPPSSCSSSEAEDLDGVPPETSCVWEPKTAATAAGERCKKSNSTGSSKRWKFRNFLSRNNSEGGRDRIVFSAPDKDPAKKRDEQFEKSKVNGGKVAAVEQHAKSGGDRRLQSSLPYRRDMMVFFGNANGMNWN